jgi:hypothetical protein
LALLYLGNVLSAEADQPAGREHYDRAAELFKRANHGWGLHNAQNNLGVLAETDRDYEAARNLHEANLQLARRLGIPFRLAMSLENLTGISVLLGELPTARSYMREWLAVQDALRDVFSLPHGLDTCAELAFAEDQPERALRLSAAAASLQEAVGSPPQPLQVARREAWLERACAALPPEVREAAWREGSQMDVGEAVSYALAGLTDDAGPVIAGAKDSRQGMGDSQLAR